MRFDSLSQLYVVLSKKLQGYIINLKPNCLCIKSASNHIMRINKNSSFFDVYIDDFFYYSLDAYDIDEAIECIINNHIWIKDNEAHILMPKDLNKIRKKDQKFNIFKF